MCKRVDVMFSYDNKIKKSVRTEKSIKKRKRK